MALRTREFQNVHDLEFFLRGGIRGGKQVVNATGLIHNLEGKTLVFNAPVGTVTFAAGAAGAGGGLTPKEVVAQIVAVVATLEASFRGGVLNLVEAAPSAGVDLDATGTANVDFGFSAATDSAGVVINGVGGAAPAINYLIPKANNDGYVVVIDEA